MRYGLKKKNIGCEPYLGEEMGWTQNLEILGHEGAGA